MSRKSVASIFAVIASLSVTPGVIGTVRAEQSAGQDIKDAAHSVADATRKTVHTVKRSVKKGIHKSAEAVAKGARKVEDKTQ